MNVLRNLEPNKMFEYFEKICAIPHGSGNMKAISDFIVDFAIKNKLEHYRDEANNVIVISDATSGRYDQEPIILQGHLDMVCAKTEDADFNFETDGAFRSVYLQTNLFMDNAASITESIVSLDLKTVDAEIQEEYRKAVAYLAASDDDQ